MNPVVIYSTRSGNTKKVALEIAQELDCNLIKIFRKTAFSQMSTKDFDLVILGACIRVGEVTRIDSKKIDTIGRTED